MPSPAEASRRRRTKTRDPCTITQRTVELHELQVPRRPRGLDSVKFLYDMCTTTSTTCRVRLPSLGFVKTTCTTTVARFRQDKVYHDARRPWMHQVPLRTCTTTIPCRTPSTSPKNVYHLPSLEDLCTTSSTTSVNHYRRPSKTPWAPNIHGT